MKRVSIQARDLGYELPSGESLFEGLNLVVNGDDRIALIGRNGSGKTTLMRVLAQEIAPSEGTIQRVGGCVYVPQLDVSKLRLSGSVMEYVMERWTNDWWLVIDEARNVFRLELDPNHQIGVMSGGELTKLNIAAALALKPAVICLDEPTNHLDLESKEKLRDVVERFDGGVLIVSHDSRFMDGVAKKVWELEKGKVTVFGGNYSDYLRQKEVIDEASERALETAMKERRKVRQSIALQEKRAAKSRRRGKELVGDRSMSMIEKGYFRNRASATAGRIGGDLREHLAEVQELVDTLQPEKERYVRVEIERGERNPGRRLYEVHGGSLVVGGGVLVDNIDFGMSGRDRVAVAGANGSGKTSFIRALMSPSDQCHIEGEIYKDGEVSFLYLDQKYAVVDLETSLVDNVSRANPGITYQQVRQALGNFLFYGRHIVEKQAKFLSGGEVARLAFAMASISPVDVLVLDEPTNNLDLPTIDVIVRAVRDFDGGVIVVSHNVDFLRKIKVERTVVISNRQLNELSLKPDDDGYYEKLLVLSRSG